MRKMVYDVVVHRKRSKIFESLLNEKESTFEF